MSIAVGETVATACRLVIGRTGELFRVGLVLILGMFAIFVFALRYLLPLLGAEVPQTGGAHPGAAMPDPRLYPGGLAMLVAEFLFIANFGVGWHRLILLGPDSGLGVALGRRELAYFGRMWLCFLGMLLFTFAFSIAEVMIAGLLGAEPRSFLAIASVGYVLVVIYALARLGPAFAGLAIDRPFGFAQAWQATRGEGLRLVAVYLLAGAGWFAVAFVFSLLAEALRLGEAAPYALLFINAVLFTAFQAVLVTINAMLFRQLAGRAGTRT